MIKYSLAFL